jgi:hypothetical protein
MTLAAQDRCSGTGMKMMQRTFTRRRIEEADRQKFAGFVEAAEARGDHDDAQFYRDSVAEWEVTAGHTDQRMVCAICGSTWLIPTSRGTARPHRRHDMSPPSWDQVRQLRQDIQTLEAELDRLLTSLEP